MSRTRLASLVLGASAILVWAALPGAVLAYDNDATHQHIVGVAAELFGFPDLIENLDMVVYGAWCEDEEDHVYDTTSFWVTIPHFWVADEGDEQTNWWGAYEYENAWMKARIMINWARDFYLAGDHREAYHYLGHVCHLLADMTVPAHAHYDEHSDDAYENWMAGWYVNMNADTASLYGPVAEITPEIIQQIMDSWGGISPGPLDLVPPLYYLMYTANQRADYFASDGFDGNLSERHGWVDYTGWPAAPRVTEDLEDCDENDTDEGGKLSSIAYKCLTYAVTATARLYEVWRDHFDSDPPHTRLTIAGPDSVHEGWRPDGVTMTLTAHDDFSGVYETRYGGWGLANRTYTEPVAITDEGLTFFSWQSMDRFGNEEELQQVTIKIDRTPPVVSITSPDPDELYLTSGTLMIGYEATDERSGLWGFTATLDGRPVGNGDVFDMALMAGTHLLALTAEDMAGNTATTSVDFSIKIDAAVQLRPEMLDLGSGGGTLTAFVAFPPPYDVRLIDVPATILSVGGVDVPAHPKLSEVGSVGVDGLLERSFKFKRALICEALADQTGIVEPIVSGELTDGVEFLGTGRLEVFTDLEADLAAGGGAAEGATTLPSVLALRTASIPGAAGAVLECALPAAGDLSLRIYDVRGRLVASLGDGSAGAGLHRREWNGRDRDGARVPGGIYLARLESRGATAVAKILLVGGR